MRSHTTRKVLAIGISIAMLTLVGIQYVFASTTIDSNVNTGGTLTVTGNATIGSASTTITIGNTTGTSGITQSVGTGNYTLNGVGASTYSIGAATTTGTITIGGTSQTGDIYIGTSTATNNIVIGATPAAGRTQTIIIGNPQTNSVADFDISIGGGTVSGTSTVTLGSQYNASSTNIYGGTGGIILSGTTSTPIDIGTGITTGSITIGEAAQTGSIFIGTSTISGGQRIKIAVAAGSSTVQIGNGVDGLLLIGTSSTATSGIRAILSNTATLDFGSVGTTTCEASGTSTIVIQGIPSAAGSTTVALGAPDAVGTTTNSMFFAWVMGNNTVGIKHCNAGGTLGAAINPASAVYRATVIVY